MYFEFSRSITFGSKSKVSPPIIALNFHISIKQNEKKIEIYINGEGHITFSLLWCWFLGNLLLCYVLLLLTHIRNSESLPLRWRHKFVRKRVHEQRIVSFENSKQEFYFIVLRLWDYICRPMAVKGLIVWTIVSRRLLMYRNASTDCIHTFRLVYCRLQNFYRFADHLKMMRL